MKRQPTTATRTARTIAEITADIASGFFYDNASTMLEAQPELLATLAEILIENYPGDTMRDHTARLARHYASAIDDAKALAASMTTTAEMTAVTNARKAAARELAAEIARH